MASPEDPASGAGTGDLGARPRSPRLPRSARRKQLLAAAQEVFVAQGYHAAAMDDIAERAGVSKPVLYQHFPGKLELYLALLDQHADDLVSRVRDALSSTTDNKARVDSCVAAYFDFVTAESNDSPGAFRLVFESDLNNDPLVAARVEQMHNECAEAVAETIAKDTGSSPVEAHLLSIGMIGLAEVAARWWLQSPGLISRDAAVRLLGALTWRGIAGFPRTEDQPGFADGVGGSASPGSVVD
ncbi:TetR/AcrR family transcriptional regulator [Acidothermaceae bacterium B102]|nr:TetR/AcrR family transcriptional regulator [Acidothermaceae bacterium B102]